jgi:hypothetical protein
MTFDERAARDHIRQLEKKAKDADDDFVMFIRFLLAIPALFVFAAIINAFVKPITGGAG